MEYNKMLACLSPSQLRCLDAMLQAAIEDNISNEGRENLQAASELIRVEFASNVGSDDWPEYQWAAELGRKAS